MGVIQVQRSATFSKLGKILEGLGNLFLSGVEIAVIAFFIFLISNLHNDEIKGRLEIISIQIKEIIDIM
jgi:hypothetical protein